jgi:zinc-ribbon domain
MPDCTQCGKPLADDAAFCSACGAPVVPTGADTGAPSDAARPTGAKPGANIVMITALAVIAIVAVIGIVLVATRDSGSRSRTIDPFQLQQTSSEDSAVKEGIHSIQIGIQSWAVDNGDVFPPDAEVRPDGGVGTEVDNWPTNPFTGQPTTSGSGPGDFTVP